jgi:nuclear pore complex protein Nup93
LILFVFDLNRISLGPGIIEQGAAVLHLKDTNEYHNQILIRAARHAQENDRMNEAIKL